MYLLMVSLNLVRLYIDRYLLNLCLDKGDNGNKSYFTD